MAVYKTVDAEQLDADLLSVADAMRRVSGNLAGLSFPSGFREEMDGVNTKVTAQAALIAEIKAALLAEAEEEPQGGLPEEYTRVEYIASDGNQHLDTLFAPNNNTKVVIDAELTEHTEYKYPALFGSNQSENYFYLFALSGNKWAADFASGRYEMTASALGRRVYTVDGKNKVASAGNVTVALPSATFESTYTMWLFGINYSTANYAKAKIYSCQIYDNDEMILDLVPCIDPNGEAGLYDLVFGQFYGNEGTGVLIAGPEVAAA